MTHTDVTRRGETIYGIDGHELLVFDVVPVDEEDLPFVGLLMLEPV